MGNYLGQFFCQGIAIQAREVGLIDEEIQILGYWKSDSYWLYIDTSIADNLNAL